MTSFLNAGARVSTKCRDPKPAKLVIGPPTSSASLLAFAPPLTSYSQSLQTPAYSSDLKDSSDFAPRSSACDPLLSSVVSPYATADLLHTKPSPTPPPPPPPVDLSAFEFPRKNLKFVEMLGEGQFGEVFIYLFPEFRMQPYNSKAGYTIQYAYMDTKGRMCRHLHSTNKTKNASN